MSGAWDPDGLAELWAIIPCHWKTRLKKAELGNPNVPGHRGHGLIRRRGKGMCRRAHH